MSGDRVSRAHVARALDCSITQVRRYERARRLSPDLGPGGVHLFEPADVERLRLALATIPSSRRRNGARHRGTRARRDEALAQRERGALEAAVFECFDRGLQLPDVVIQTRAHHELVRELRVAFDLDYEQGERVRRRREAEKRDERERLRLERVRAERRRLDASIQRAALLGRAAPSSRTSSSSTTLPGVPDLPDAGDVDAAE